MTLQHCDIIKLVPIAIGTFMSTFAANTVKNTVANNLHARLKHQGSITINNYDDLRKEIGVLTRCSSFVYLIFFTSLMEIVLLAALFVYAHTDGITNWFILSIEALVWALYPIGIMLTFISLVIIFLSPGQNMLTSRDWGVPPT